MANPSKAQHEYSMGILSVIPIFFVAWSDTVLSPSEVKSLREKINSFDFLSIADKKQLLAWMDPSQPPTKEVFKSWYAAIKQSGEVFSIEKKTSLAEMGFAMAKKGGSFENDSVWTNSGTLKALQTLENDFGIANPASHEILQRKLSGHANLQEEQVPTFTAKNMQTILDGTEAETKNRVKILLRDPFFAYKEIPDKDAYRERVLEWCMALAKQGFGAYAFPKEYGGSDRVIDHMTVFETLGHHDLSLGIKFGVQFGLFGGAVFGLGTEIHHEKYLPDLGTMELPGCFAMTETGHGSNVRGLETTATYLAETDEIEIHTPHRDAGKEYIGNGLHGQMAVVFAQLIVGDQNHGVHAILVPIRSKQGELLENIKAEDCGHKMGLNGVDNARLWFHHVRVPRENLLNKYGSILKDGSYSSSIENPNKRFFIMLGALVAGRVCVALAGLSASKSALTIAIKYSLKRRQFAAKDGDPENIIMDYPTHQHRLIPRLATTYALSFALTKLKHQYVQKKGTDEMKKLESIAAGMKAYATWFARDTIQVCRETCGGKGYLSENRFAALKADTDIFTTFEGDNTVLMQLVAKGLLSSFNQAFHDEGYLAVAKYLANRFTTSILDKNPYSIRNTNVDHLMDEEFHLTAIKFREQKLLVSVGLRMRSYLKKRMSPHDAYLRCQLHMAELAEAYIERLILKNFIEAKNEVEDNETKAVLTEMCSLFALTLITKHKGWFFENDFLSGAKSKAIRRLSHKIIQDLRPQLNELVDAFGIPDELLGAQII